MKKSIASGIALGVSEGMQNLLKYLTAMKAAKTEDERYQAAMEYRKSQDEIAQKTEARKLAEAERSNLESEKQRGRQLDMQSRELDLRGQDIANTRAYQQGSLGVQRTQAENALMNDAIGAATTVTYDEYGEPQRVVDWKRAGEIFQQMISRKFKGGTPAPTPAASPQAVGPPQAQRSRPAALPEPARAGVDPWGLVEGRPVFPGSGNAWSFDLNPYYNNRR